MIQKIGVIGAGQMGSGIAHVCAVSGYDVKLSDISADALAKAVSNIERNLERQVSKGKISAEDKHAALERITTGTDLAMFGDSDLVIEAATEAEETKREIFKTAGSAFEPDRADRQQHVVDLDHAACRRDRPAGQVHRHALHEPGAGDAARRADSRHRDR